VLLAAVLVWQFRTTAYRVGVYWLAVALISFVADARTRGIYTYVRALTYAAVPGGRFFQGDFTAVSRA
jgi:uncharacterized membrane-anchored protein